MADTIDLKDQNELLRDNLELIRQNNDELRNEVSLAKQLNANARLTVDQYRNLNTLSSSFANFNKKIVDEITKRESLTRKLSEIQKDQNALIQAQSNYQTEINQLLDKKNLKNAAGNKLSAIGQKNIDRIISGLQSQLELSQDISTQLSTEEAIRTKIGNSMGIAGGLLKAMSSTLKVLGIDNVSVLKNSELQIAALEKEGKLRDGIRGKLQSLSIIGKEVGKAFVDGLKDPLIWIKLLTDGMRSFDELVGKTGKSFGISYNEASKITQELSQVSRETNNTFVSTKALVEAQNQLITSLGTSATLSSDMLVTYTELTKQAGYSVETATTLSKLSGATGKSTKDITTQYLGQVKALSLQNGIAINNKALLDDINNTSKGLLATYSKQPSKLAEAAFEAKKLGANIKEVEGISQSLLEIESSISNEFEAEVMTGRQLNLEKARYFALTNDIAGVAKEITKQGIDLNAWSGMNVLQQESMAKSMGMSKDQMAGMLLESSALSKLGMQDNEENRKKLQYLRDHGGSLEAINKLGQEELDRQLKSTSTQERFVALTEKLKDLFVGMAGPIMDVVSPLMDLVSAIWTPISWISEHLGSWGKSISEVIGPLNGVMKVMKGIAMLAVGYAAYAAFANIATFAPIVGPVLGGIAAAAILAAGTSFLGSIQDGQIDPNGGLVVSGPKGSIQLDSEDTFVGNKNGITAGTNLGGKKENLQNNSSNDGSISILASTLGNKMDTMISKLDILVNVMREGMTVNLDGDKVSNSLGTPMAIANRRI